LDEIMHALYFAYYPLVIGGIVIAWTGGRRRGPTPAPGFHTAFTGMMLGFFLAYVWYPFLPARGPWENADLVAGLRPFAEGPFTHVIGLIISAAAVSGGCFPSAHVSGAWAVTYGLSMMRAKATPVFLMAAMGLSIACIYTRYHHGVDVIAGFVVGIAGGRLGAVLAPGKRASH
ncbi:MAG TPA: phosphatase PAP2 family protein, partial [Vicinamibacterales bacterium]|nr:phosphatase PAP2 family protein [Vicinamibacterales bacterium]